MIDILALRTIIRKNSLECTDKDLTTLIRFAELIIDWNKKINLISRRDEENILERHIIVSLSLLFKFAFAADGSVLDLGTGGGLPGIPLAILCRTNNFTLLDSIQKKMVAVKEMVKDLKLSNITVSAGRAEDLSQEPHLQRSFHCVVSRAVASVTELIKWSKPFLLSREADDKSAQRASNGRQIIPCGSIVIYKGGDLSGELLEAERKMKPFRVSVHAITINGIDEHHAHDKKLVIIEP